MRFEKAVQKAVRLRSLLNMAETPVMNEEEITVKVEYKNVKIKLSTILYYYCPLNRKVVSPTP